METEIKTEDLKRDTRFVTDKEVKIRMLCVDLVIRAMHGSGMAPDILSVLYNAHKLELYILSGELLTK